ncbi:hypothetical protein CDL12_10278 [Handroanthus impetiginosus]|uniref:C2H2-type domain-containing protein n=1 Tax=Handroanthus impetiginosus TaxID=429701 RepID=A0A2G9H639_9LAMI|nr:hypothetical protein CDL12_14414 [Handroanthus impetiginosus]PIN17063.1 hypothetical protein CDL12_10278 [Handroanthus impetiginosus]
MEQTRYWMWAKRKPDSNPHNMISSYGDSWEEQAFAEDAAGALGGCVWPPRSYSCSFCRREFRSAQALGGHMNVHRRDRARLKQSPINNPPTEVLPQNHDLHTCTPYSSENICTLLYNNNPNPDRGPLVSVPLIRVSSPPDQEKTSTLSFFSPLVQKHDNWSSFVAGKRNRVLDSIKNEERKAIIVEPDSRTEKEDCVTDDLSMNLNLKQANTSSDDEVASCKRRKIEAKPLSVFPKLSAVDKCFSQSEVSKLRSGSNEELDLELRLGEAPKVK